MPDNRDHWHAERPDREEELLAEEGYIPQVVQAGTADLNRLRSFRPDAIVLDTRMGNPQAGWEILAALQQNADEAWLDDEEINHLLSLVDSGLAWSLPGRFGRLVDDLIGLADNLIEAGDVSLP